MCKIPDFLKELSRKFCYILYTSISDLKLQFLKLSKLGLRSHKSKIIRAIDIFGFYEIFRLQ